MKFKIILSILICLTLMLGACSSDELEQLVAAPEPTQTTASEAPDPTVEIEAPEPTEIVEANEIVTTEPTEESTAIVSEPEATQTTTTSETAVDTSIAEETGFEADVVFLNGAIYTVDLDQPWAEAVAIQDDILTYVGSDAGVEDFIGDDTIIIDLDGKMMLPGIHDVHVHPIEAGSDATATCLLSASDSLESQVSRIQECASTPTNIDWVLGWGHSIEMALEALEGDRLPIDILDEAIPDRPAIMVEQTSHSSWVNSEALAVMGFDKDSPNPPGGVILKDPYSGEPTGILLENAGDMMLHTALASTPELDELNYEGLLYSLEKLGQNGITSISDARIYWQRNYHETWLRAEREELLTVRAVLGLWAYPEVNDSEQLDIFASLYRNDPEQLVRISQIKLYSDGLLENTTAASLDPYLFDLGVSSDNMGLNYFDETRLTQYVTEVERLGFDVHVHAIGDRGVYETLNAVEAAIATNGDQLDRRHRLTHVELVDPADYPRFAELNVIADFQVAGDWTLPGSFNFLTEFIGERAEDHIPVRDLYDAGATVTLSSDWDVSALSPFNGMANALLRDHQSLPNLDAVIEAYTINGAYLMRQETRTGSLEVGKWADLIVIDQNIFDVHPDAIRDTKVLLTLLGGEVVFRDPDGI
ncbi:MAG: amidohydrolase [Chloroflexota bacterium]